jgi:hypothetical protein
VPLSVERVNRDRTLLAKALAGLSAGPSRVVPICTTVTNIQKNAIDGGCAVTLKCQA